MQCPRGLRRQRNAEANEKGGCHLIKFGAGPEKAVLAVKKGIAGHPRQAFEWCSEIGIDTAHFMVGTGDPRTMEDTIKFACEVKPSTATFTYPGTPLFRDVARQDGSIRDGTDNASIERLHVQGDFNRFYCDAPGDQLQRM